MGFLSDELAACGPYVIGATGGSGTRVTARIVRDAGMFIGTDLNAYEDALTFGELSDTWINRYVAADATAREALEPSMLEDLRKRLDYHLSTKPADAVAWGWKEPRSIYLLPFLDKHMPTLKFLHFIRDGRDMAFSDNQKQLEKHGRTVFDNRWPAWRRPLRSIELWNRVNLQAADFGERVLGERYLCVRFEDLCGKPAETVARIFDFFGLEGDAEAVAAAEVRPPGSLGRWRDEGARLVADIERRGAEALRRFDYA
ncbi:MAG: sulfotransferase [Gaiellales bacterium]